MISLFKKDVQANSRKLKVTVTSEDIFDASNLPCTANSNGDTSTSSRFGVLVKGLALIRGMDIKVSLITNNQAGAADGDHRITAHVFLQRTINFVTGGCTIDMNKAYASGEIGVKVEGSKMSFLLDTLVEVAMKEFAFKFHETLVIYFTPIDGSTISARLPANSEIIFDASYNYRKEAFLPVFHNLNCNITKLFWSVIKFNC